MTTTTTKNETQSRAYRGMTIFRLRERSNWFVRDGLNGTYGTLTEAKAAIDNVIDSCSYCDLDVSRMPSCPYIADELHVRVRAAAATKS